MDKKWKVCAYGQSKFFDLDIAVKVSDVHEALKKSQAKINKIEEQQQEYNKINKSFATIMKHPSSKDLQQGLTPAVQICVDRETSYIEKMQAHKEIMKKRAYAFMNFYFKQPKENQEFIYTMLADISDKEVNTNKIEKLYKEKNADLLSSKLEIELPPSKVSVNFKI